MFRIQSLHTRAHISANRYTVPCSDFRHTELTPCALAPQSPPRSSGMFPVSRSECYLRELSLFHVLCPFTRTLALTSGCGSRDHSTPSLGRGVGLGYGGGHTLGSSRYGSGHSFSARQSASCHAACSSGIAGVVEGQRARVGVLPRPLCLLAADD